MNTLLVPTLPYDTRLLERLANSIDYPIENKIVVNSGRRGAIDSFLANHRDWHAIQREGIGVAASNNIAAILAKARGEDTWLICNDDCHFEPGALKRLRELADARCHDTHFIFSNADWCCFAWTRLAVDEIGLFDENFYPSCFEDTDMYVRMGIAGARDIQITDGPKVLHDRPYPWPAGYGEKRSEWFRLLEAYFCAKWGKYSLKLKRPYGSPFNNPELTVKACPIVPAHLEACKRIKATLKI